MVCNGPHPQNSHLTGLLLALASCPQTEEQVLSAILHTLWDVPLQLVALLSTDAAKGGR